MANQSMEPPTVFVRCLNSFIRETFPVWVKVNHRMTFRLDTSRLPPDLLIDSWKLVATAAGDREKRHDARVPAGKKMCVKGVVTGTGHFKYNNKQQTTFFFEFYRDSSDEAFASGTFNVVVLTQSADDVRARAGHLDEILWMPVPLGPGPSSTVSSPASFVSDTSSATDGDDGMEHAEPQAMDVPMLDDQELWGLITQLNDPVPERDHHIQNVWGIIQSVEATQNTLVQTSDGNNMDQTTYAVLDAVRAMLYQVLEMRKAVEPPQPQASPPMMHYFVKPGGGAMPFQTEQKPGQYWYSSLEEATTFKVLVDNQELKQGDTVMVGALLELLLVVSNMFIPCMLVILRRWQGEASLDGEPVNLLHPERKNEIWYLCESTKRLFRVEQRVEQYHMVLYGLHPPTGEIKVVGYSFKVRQV